MGSMRGFWLAGAVSLLSLASAAPAISADGVMYVYRSRPEVTLALTVSAAPRVAVANNPFRLKASATGGKPAYTYSVSPALPSGLSLNASTGLISGTAPAAADYGSFTVTAQDSKGETASATFPLNVAAFGVNPPEELEYVEGLRLSEAEPETAAAAQGGRGPYTYSWAEDSSAPPAWLTLGSDGLFTGTAETGEWSGLKLKVRDADGLEAASNAFAIRVARSGVLSWGSNWAGFLGNGTMDEWETPQPMALPGGRPRMVSSGWDTVCAIAGTGKAYCWGYNERGSLGNPEIPVGNRAYRPYEVSMPSGAPPLVSILAGGATSCALDQTGSVWCWGHNGEGQLGNGTMGANSTVPSRVSMPAGVTFKQIGKGYYFTCGLDLSGRAWCWGQGGGGEIGNGVLAHSSTPAQVTMPTGVSFSQIHVGEWSTCGLGSDGNVYCWGTSDTGQIGNGGPTGSSARFPLPVAVTKPAGVTSFKALSSSGPSTQHICAIGDDDRAYCWGYNWYSQLGVGDSRDTLPFAKVPTLVAAPEGITFSWIEAGVENTCAGGGTSGGIWCWGSNDYSELLDGTHQHRATPQRFDMSKVAPFTRVYIGYDVAFAY